MRGQNEDEKYMWRCLDLALQGKGRVAPNPLVGCVIVHDNIIIGEGYHREYGQAHAEVIAIGNVTNQDLLRDSTLYVNLEPCSHYGKTPPCAGLIVEKKIPRVIIGSSDPNLLVAGNGIKFLRENGVNVTGNIIEKECKSANRRFFTWHLKKRPYIILKWARSADGFIDLIRTPDAPIGPNWITSQQARILVHKWRSEEQAILVGTNTVLKDDPKLNIRDWKGKNPLRVVIDRRLMLKSDHHVFDNSQETLVIYDKHAAAVTVKGNENTPGKTIKNITRAIETEKTRFTSVIFDETAEARILDILYREEIQSVIIEGGAFTLKQFIKKGLWDEARIFTGPAIFKNGIHSPEIAGKSGYSGMIDNSSLLVLFNE